MAITTKLRLHAVTQSFNPIDEAGIVDTGSVPLDYNSGMPAATSDLTSENLGSALSIMASAIRRIHGHAGFSQAQPGHFANPTQVLGDPNIPTSIVESADGNDLFAVKVHTNMHGAAAMSLGIGASELRLNDNNIANANLWSIDELKLSSAPASYENYEAVFGGKVALLDAIILAAEGAPTGVIKFHTKVSSYGAGLESDFGEGLVVVSSNNFSAGATGMELELGVCGTSGYSERALGGFVPRTGDQPGDQVMKFSGQLLAESIYLDSQTGVYGPITTANTADVISAFSALISARGEVRRSRIVLDPAAPPVTATTVASRDVVPGTGGDVLTVEAVTPGSAGNDLSVEVIQTAQSSDPSSVSLSQTGDELIIRFRDPAGQNGPSSFSDIEALIQADASVSALFQVSFAQDGAFDQIVSSASLTGGADQSKLTIMDATGQSKEFSFVDSAYPSSGEIGTKVDHGLGPVAVSPLGQLEAIKEAIEVYAQWGDAQNMQGGAVMDIYADEIPGAYQGDPSTFALTIYHRFQPIGWDGVKHGGSGGAGDLTTAAVSGDDLWSLSIALETDPSLNDGAALPGVQLIDNSVDPDTGATSLVLQQIRDQWNQYNNVQFYDMGSVSFYQVDGGNAGAGVRDLLKPNNFGDYWNFNTMAGSTLAEKLPRLDVYLNGSILVVMEGMAGSVPGVLEIPQEADAILLDPAGDQSDLWLKCKFEIEQKDTFQITGR